MKKLILLSIASLFASCTQEAYNQELQKEPNLYTSNQKDELHNDKPITFTVKWDSNQIGATCRFTKHIFRDCTIVSSTEETHTEKSFEITLDPEQRFEIAILKESPVKNPKVSLSLYKDGNVIYNETFNSGSFYYIGQVNAYGGIKN